MAIDFPASPTNGQTFTVGSVTYTWDGTKWTALASGGGASLSPGTARQLLQTDAAGTAVEWTSNVDIPGTLDVTGATTLDGNLTVDTNTLFVDATNNRVGVGDNAPTYRLTSSLSSTGTSISSYANTDIALGLVNTGAATTNQTLPILFRYADGTYNGNGLFAAVRESGTGRGQAFLFAPSDVNGNPTERMRINSLGNVFIGGGGVTPQAATRLIITNPNTTESTPSFVVENSSFFASIYCFNVNTGGVNTQNAAMWIQKSSSTGRSVNAAGTINASGTDYAEYIVKAGNFTIAKGDICGITANGLLTLDYANAVSFVVKSTNPSYVGGDTWGSEDVVGKKPDVDDLEALAQWEANLEAARQTVDRIAFAGQAPVNVTNAVPGQYIVPIATETGGITGIAKDEGDLTLAEYIRAVGKVIAIEDDGRARIIVKVA